MNDIAAWDREIGLYQGKPAMVTCQEKVVISEIDIVLINDSDGVRAVNLWMDDST